MSGLLRNLAGQALSLPPAMRPAARLRSAATSGQDEVIQEHGPIIASKPAATERSRVEDVQERTPNALPPSSSTTQSIKFDREPAQTKRASDRALATSLATREVTDHGDRLKAAPVAAIAQPSAALIADAPAKSENPRDASREIDTDDVSRVGPNPIRPARQHLRSREAPARFDVSARVRERIVQDRAAPADVHIHINRVELTALTAPAPSPRASASRPNKPMSLDQYLQQRKRKTP
jgi:hypothetical protein